MRLLTAVVALAGAIGSAFAQSSDFHALTRPGMNEEVPAGKSYTVTWNVAEKYADEKVVIGLLGGTSGSTLHPLGTIGTADGSDGSFTWSVDSSLGQEKTYGLVISLASDTSIYQYSTPFSISGGVKAETTTTEKSSSAEPTTTKKKETTSSTPEPTTTSKKEKSTTTEEKTTSSTTSSEETTSTPETTSTRSSSTTTSFLTVTGPGSGTDKPTTTEASPSASATSEPDDESGGGGGKILGLSTGAFIGAAAGGLAGVLLLIAIAVKAVRMKRSRENDRYQDIDGHY